MSFENKVALITGASRGIGRAIALALGKAGATVIGTATTADGAHGITETLMAEGIKGAGLQLNVRDPNSIETTMGMIKDRFGMPLILINNAAVTKDNLFMRMKEEEWSAVIETNLSAIFRLSKVCIRDMLKARWGRIISIGSVVGSTGNPGQANYCAAKAGLIGLSKSLAQEVGSRDITVNVISPGFIDTDMTKVLPEEQRKILLDRIPMQRAGRPEDIAAAVLFLASDAAAYITGQTLHINGGMYMA